MKTVLLLVCSNIFMTLAWYGQLRLKIFEGKAQKKGRLVLCESGPGLVAVSSQRQKKRIVLVAILACSSSEQPALVGTPAEASVGFTRALLSR